MRSFYLLLCASLMSFASFALVPGPITGITSGCIGSTNTLSDSVGGGIWTSNNTGVATIGSLSGIVTGISIGTATISYSVGGSFVTTVAYINPYTTPSISISASPSDTVCAGFEITFHTVITNGGSSPGYQWKLNGSDAGILSSFSYYPTGGDTVAVVLTSSAACTSPDTAFSMIVPFVRPSLIPSDSIGATPGTTIGGGEWDTLTAVVTGGGTAFYYQWVVNSTNVPGAILPVYITDSLANNDSVTCIVVSVGPCGGDTAFNSISITVGPSGVVTPGKMGGFSLFPNPTNGAFTVKGMMNQGFTGEQVELKITDMVGKEVYSRNVVGVNGKINEQFQLNGILKSGVYLLHIVAEDERNVVPIVVSGE